MPHSRSTRIFMYDINKVIDWLVSYFSGNADFILCNDVISSTHPVLYYRRDINNDWVMMQEYITIPLVDAVAAYIVKLTYREDIEMGTY